MIHNTVLLSLLYIPVISLALRYGSVWDNYEVAHCSEHQISFLSYTLKTSIVAKNYTFISVWFSVNRINSCTLLINRISDQATDSG